MGYTGVFGVLQWPTGASMSTQREDNFRTMDRSSDPGARPERPPAPPPPESVAGGRYKIERLLGEGGQKQVFLARDTRLDREVVVSLLKTDYLDETSVARLWREAQAMGQLGDHPNIVTVYDVGEEAGRPYIVTQYVPGGAVTDLLEAADKHRLPVEQVLRLGGQVCRALTHAHSHGVVHRDLKPGNIWLTPDGAAKLGDFGLALRQQFSRVTIEGALVGTVAYMSPEQALGQKATPASDLYALGAMLYEMAAGRPPFLGDSLVGVISQHINTAAVAPSWHNPEIPPALEDLILRLLAKTPEERPPNAESVVEELAAIEASASLLAERVEPADTRSLARLAGGVFVGREKETQQLRAAFKDAESGRGRLILLVGEPGCGKTRTAEQLATYARLRDAQVLSGRCYEGEGAPAFWPWIQIIRSWVQEEGSRAVSSAMGAGAPEIAQMVPEVRERLPALAAPPALEPEQARFRLFDSVTTFLKNAARRRPLVLILDDLHWADRPSLLLLEFLARELRSSRLLVVGAYRDVAVGRQHPLSQTLAELARQGAGDRIALGGLAQADVERFMEMTAGLKPPEALAAAIHRETEGNPFFVNEVVRLMVAEGRLTRPDQTASWSVPIPQGVREVIGRRLEQLSAPCNRVLAVAAVVGRGFTVEVLGALVDLTEDHLLEVLEEAVAARVIAEAPHTIGRYSFTQTLIRETLYESLSANRRLRLHRRIGEVLEKLYGADPSSRLAELAYHFYHAAPAGDSGKAADYAVRAAQQAAEMLGYEEAAVHYQRAIEVLQRNPPVDEKRRLELLLTLGDAHKKAGNTAVARETFEHTTEAARRLGAAEQLAAAALGMQTVTAVYGKIDEVQLRLLWESLGALPQQDSALRARVLAHLSIALYYSPEQRVELSQEALDMARRVGDPAALVAALYARHIALVLTENVAERLAVSTEILRIAEASGNKEMAVRAHYRRILDLTELGEMGAVDREIEAYAKVAAELRQPIYAWFTPYFRASRAVFEGRFAECERLAQEAVAIGRRAQDPTAPLFYGVQMNLLRLEQGRAEELVPGVKTFIERYPMIPGHRAVLCHVYARTGKREETRAEFEPLAANDFAALPRDGSWILSVTGLAWVCRFLGDVARAEMLYRMLLPYAGRNVIIGSSGVACGSICRSLGLLAATMSRWDDAARHFESAIAMNSRMNARPFLAEAQHEYAVMLLSRGAAGDREKAAGLLGQALATARELGMQKLAGDAAALRDKAGLARQAPSGAGD